MAKKQFNTVLDIKGIEKRYPASKYVVFFQVNEGEKYFLFSCYTKRNLTEPNIIELDKTTYEDAKNKYLSEIDTPVEIISETIEDMADTIINVELTNISDHMTIAQSLQL